jgi:hypothetical protein
LYPILISAYETISVYLFSFRLLLYKILFGYKKALYGTIGKEQRRLGMAICDSCKREVGDGMGFCPFCGADLPPETESREENDAGGADAGGDKEEG